MLKRVSPIDMGLKAERIMVRDGWEISLTYVGERPRSALFLADLSHVPKWTLNGPNLHEMRPAGSSMPAKPGMISLERGLLLVRCIPWECRIMSLGEQNPVLKVEGLTDVTDAYAAIAVVGTRCFDVLAKLSPIDLEGRYSLKAALAPVEDVTCLLVHLDGADGIPGIILTCARGDGHFLTDAILDAGKEYSIRKAGWERFGRWITGTSAEAKQADDLQKGQEKIIRMKR